MIRRALNGQSGSVALMWAALLFGLLLPGCDSGPAGPDRSTADLLAPVSASVRADTSRLRQPIFAINITVDEMSPYTYDIISVAVTMVRDGEDIGSFDVSFSGPLGPGSQRVDTLALDHLAPGIPVDSHDDYNCLRWYVAAVDMETTPNSARSDTRDTCGD